MAVDILHVRHNGRSSEYGLANLDLSEQSTDGDILRAVARHLDLPLVELAGHVVVRNATAIVVRPEAIYG